MRSDALTIGRARFGRLAPVWTRPWPRLSAAALVFTIPLIAYLSVGAILVFGTGAIAADAFSRVGNAYYMLFSRDPHLAAIGFVWNPLPALAALVLMPFSVVWPSLVQQGFAGNIVSAVFMAAAVHQVWGWCRDLRIGRLARLLVTALFAAHPLIVLYGANGMSEAPFVFFLVAAARQLGGWVHTQRIGALVWAGTALALAYLTRYEAIAAAAGAFAFVAGFSLVRARGALRERASVAFADVVVFGMPFAAAFALWALASWIIMGSPFEALTSVYGGSSQIAIGIDQIKAAIGDTPGAALGFSVRQIVGLEPLMLLILVLGGLVATLRRDPSIVAITAILGSVVVFSLVLVLAGKSFGWLRFYIAVIPLSAMVAAGLVAAARSSRFSPSDGSPRMPPLSWNWTRHKVGAFARGGLIILTLVLLAAGLPSGLTTVQAPDLAREEAPHVRAVVGSSGGEVPWELHQYRVAKEVASYLDALNLPDGAVVIDVALGFWIVLQSDHPKQFVITPDRDFEAIVADPAAFGAKYLLVSPSGGLGGLSAITRAHPGVYEYGGGFATLEHEFTIAGGLQHTWRLYRIDE